jgi:hypothetical protein
MMYPHCVISKYIVSVYEAISKCTESIWIINEQAIEIEEVIEGLSD